MPVSFAILRNRLLDRLRRLVSNGEFTERGLARFLGVSQSHVHNVLNGFRALTPELFDTALSRLRIDLLDLCNEDEIAAHERGECVHRWGDWTEIPLLNSSIGRGNRWPDPAQPERLCGVPLQQTGALVAAVLEPDPAMPVTLPVRMLAALDTRLEGAAVIGPDELYVVATNTETLVRRVRAGASRVYLVDELHTQHPLCWQAAPWTDAVVKARVVWLEAMGDQPSPAKRIAEG